MWKRAVRYSKGQALEPVKKHAREQGCVGSRHDPESMCGNEMSGRRDVGIIRRHRQTCENERDKQNRNAGWSQMEAHGQIPNQWILISCSYSKASTHWKSWGRAPEESAAPFSGSPEDLRGAVIQFIQLSRACPVKFARLSARSRWRPKIVRSCPPSRDARAPRGRERQSPAPPRA